MGGAEGIRGAVLGPHPGMGLLSMPRTPAGLGAELGVGGHGRSLPKMFWARLCEKGQELESNEVQATCSTRGEPGEIHLFL